MEAQTFAHATLAQSPDTFLDAGIASCALAPTKANAEIWSEAETRAHRAVELLRPSPPFRIFAFAVRVTALLALGRRLKERAARIADPAWRARYLDDIPEHMRLRVLASAWNLESSVRQAS